jgi:lipopolysaccharide export system permease protein
MLNRIDLYIARLILVPLLGTLVIAVMLLLLDQMLRLFDFVINAGGPVSVVWRMLGNLVPQHLGMSIPIGLFLGVMLAFRKLALSSELDALTASGISWMRLLRMPMLLALLLCLLNVALVGFLQPYNRYAYEGLRFELRSGALGASIKVGEFAKLGDRIVLRVEESRDQGRDLSGIFVHTTDKEGRSIAISAERGTFLSTDNPDILLFRLYNGVLTQTDADRAQTRKLSFALHDLPIDLPRIEAFRARGGRELELTLPELLSATENLQTTEEFRMESEANLYRRLVQALVLLILPPLAIAMAIPPKRSTNAIGVFLGMTILIVYNEISEAAERLGAAGDVPILAAQAIPFALFAALNIGLFSVLTFKVGGEPIGILLRVTAPITRLLALAWRFMRRLLPIRRIERALGGPA